MKIKSLLVMPGKEVQKVKIPANIKFIKSLLGEDLQKIRVYENTIKISSFIYKRFIVPFCNGSHYFMR